MPGTVVPRRVGPGRRPRARWPRARSRRARARSTRASPCRTPPVDGDAARDAVHERADAAASSPGARPRGHRRTTAAVVDRADLVFVSGGDPTLGAKRLRDTGAAGVAARGDARGVRRAWGSAPGRSSSAPGGSTGRRTRTPPGLDATELVAVHRGRRPVTCSTHTTRRTTGTSSASWRELLRGAGPRSPLLGIPTGRRARFRRRTGRWRSSASPPFDLRVSWRRSA